MRTENGGGTLSGEPRCELCGETYAGRKELPGTRAFVRVLVSGTCAFFARMAMLVLALTLFWIMSHPPLPGWAPWAPGLAAALFVALWTYQVVVVVVSLPRTALPPRPTSFWRRFYARDAQDLSFAFSHFVMLCIFSLGMVINDEVPFLSRILSFAQRLALQIVMRAKP